MNVKMEIKKLEMGVHLIARLKRDISVLDSLPSVTRFVEMELKQSMKSVMTQIFKMEMDAAKHVKLRKNQ